MRGKTLQALMSVKNKGEEVLQASAAHGEDCGEADCPTAACGKNHTKADTHPASHGGHHVVVDVP